jgi:hypothetical protein
MRLGGRVPQGNAGHLLTGNTFGVDVTGGVGLKGVSRVTRSFAFDSFHDLTFAFFCNSGLMFDRPTTRFLPQPRPCVTVALEVCVPSPLLRIC